jgi:hypothetical protein
MEWRQLMRGFDETETQLEKLHRTIEEGRTLLASNQKRLSDLMSEVLPNIDNDSRACRDLKLAWEEMENQTNQIVNIQAQELEAMIEKRLRMLRAYLDEF